MENTNISLDKNLWLYGNGVMNLTNRNDGPACVDGRGEDGQIVYGESSKTIKKVDNFHAENLFDQNTLLYGKTK